MHESRVFVLYCCCSSEDNWGLPRFHVQATLDAAQSVGSGDKGAAEQHQSKRDRAQAALKLWRE